MTGYRSLSVVLLGAICVGAFSCQVSEEASEAAAEAAIENARASLENRIADGEIAEGPARALREALKSAQDLFSHLLKDGSITHADGRTDTDPFSHLAGLLVGRTEFSKTHVPDPTASILSLSRLVVERAKRVDWDGPAWERMKALEQYPSIAAALRRDENIIAELRAPNGSPTAIRIETKSGHIVPIDLGVARDTFMQSARIDIQKYSHGIKLFSLTKNNDGTFSILLPGMSTPGKVTEAEYHQLVVGKRLAPDHWLTQMIATMQEPIVLYSNAYMQRAGPTLEEADRFTFALQRSYPEAAFYRDPLSLRKRRSAQRIPNSSLFLVPRTSRL